MCGELKLFSLCEGMKWNHLPMAGGLYDQHPGLLDRFYYILAERAKHEAAEQAKKKNDMGAHGPKPTSRPGVSRGRR